MKSLAQYPQKWSASRLHDMPALPLIDMLLLLTSVAAFASTNIDDIFLLMLFFGNKEYRPQQVVMGQYLGFSGLVILSLTGSLAGMVIDSKYIGLLGLVPIYLGAKELLKLLRSKENDIKEAVKPANKFHGPVLSVALITFANGGDNIGIYVPLFAPLSWRERLLVVTVFLLMVAVWCWVGRYLIKHPVSAKTINRFGHIVAPIVLILLGIYILFESGSFNLFK
jgi:cadmium resistance transport/sequestration family protein